MKSLVQNRKNLLFATLMAASFGLNAQIESTHTDVKYGYTTVVYKDKAATDTDVLNALENSVGMGDVVRVTVAPPKPAPVPKVDKAKGEDTWLKPAAKPAINNLTASTATAPVAIAVNPATPKVPTAAAAPSAAPTMPKPAVAKSSATSSTAVAAPASPKPAAEKVVAAPSPAAASAKNAAPAKVEASPTAPSVAAPATVRVARSAESIKAAKSANKSLKKGKGGGYKMKNRKKGKQRYRCPKF